VIGKTTGRSRSRFGRTEGLLPNRDPKGKIKKEILKKKTVNTDTAEQQLARISNIKLCLQELKKQPMPSMYNFGATGLRYREIVCDCFLEALNDGFAFDESFSQPSDINTLAINIVELAHQKQSLHHRLCRGLEIIFSARNGPTHIIPQVVKKDNLFTSTLIQFFTNETLVLLAALGAAQCFITYVRESTTDFKISLPGYKIPNPLYSTIYTLVFWYGLENLSQIESVNFFLAVWYRFLKQGKPIPIYDALLDQLVDVKLKNHFNQIPSYLDPESIIKQIKK